MTVELSITMLSVTLQQKSSSSCLRGGNKTECKCSTTIKFNRKCNHKDLQWTGYPVSAYMTWFISEPSLVLDFNPLNVLVTAARVLVGSQFPQSLCSHPSFQVHTFSNSVQDPTG